MNQGATGSGAGDLLALGISPEREDLQQLEGIFTRLGFRFQGAGSYREALRLLCAHRMPIIICNHWLRDGNWKDILSLLAPLSEPHQLIVMAGESDNRLAAEVRSMSGFAVLSKPLREDEVVSLVAQACRNLREADRIVPMLQPAVNAA
jgi:DNA-binding NtrC family response regulator